MRFLLSAFLGLGLLCSVASAAENPAALTLKVKNVEVFPIMRQRELITLTEQ